MITIQRVRVRWSAWVRGAPEANRRRDLDRPVVLAAHLPDADVVVHEVLADEAAGYRRREEILSGGVEQARRLGLWVEAKGDALSVDRLPGWAAYPRTSAMPRLFTLAPGQVGRYRANFRFTGCACDPSWHYEDWLVHLSNGPVAADRFLAGRPDHDVDDRVHLYGGRSRRAATPG